MPRWPWRVGAAAWWLLSRARVRTAPPSASPPSSMIDALSPEIAARKCKDDGKLKVDLFNGRRVEERGPSWQYRFEVDVELRSLQDDTPVCVKVKADEVRGCVVSVRSDVLTVALKRDIGPAIPKALLIVDLTWLLERLRDRLQEVKDGSASLGATADDVLRPAAVPTADAEPHAEVMQGDRDMNEDQQRAVRRSLGSRTTFVWGPPGTGKTWTLARIVEAHYRAGRSVLLVSHTNVAVDTALEQVAERLCSEADFDRGLVLRRGPIVKDELRRRFGQQIIPAEVAVRLGGEPSRGRQATLLNRCRVLATTVHRTYIHPGAARYFDTVVIDEASMLMPPLVYWAAGLATRSVTVAGDFRQLPPIVITKKDNARKWLARDVFERAGIPDRLASGDAMPYLVSLGRQYRMRRPICKAVNRHFYADRPLRSDPICSGPSVRSKVEKFPFSSRALLWMDTAPYRPWASWSAPTDRSHYNPFHALLARNIVLRLAEVGYLPPADKANDAVGVIAPYRAQAQLTKRLLKKRLRKCVSTVHSFQGNERKAVFIDLTDSDGVKLGKPVLGTSLEQTGPRLLNVAVSRAKHHVVLIANFQYVLGKAPEPKSVFLRRLVEHFQQHGDPLNADDLLPSDGEWLNRPCPEPGCTGRLAHRPGAPGKKPFLGCTEFPACKHLEKAGAWTPWGVATL